MNKDSPDPPDIHGKSPSLPPNSNPSHFLARLASKRRHPASRSHQNSPGSLSIDASTSSKLNSANQSPLLTVTGSSKLNTTNQSPLLTIPDSSKLNTTNQPPLLTIPNSPKLNNTNQPALLPTTSSSSSTPLAEKNVFERTLTSPVAGSHATRPFDGLAITQQTSVATHNHSNPAASVTSVQSRQNDGHEPALDSKEINLDSLNLDDDAPQTLDHNASHKQDPARKRTIMQEARRSFWIVAKHSWLNVLLVFVPVGIIVAAVPGVNGGIVFAMNCIAVIPLAGLLSHATESVACNMGDALGALLNITFGNAVELIIFIIALAKNQIRIVQASLLGSILANLLLILGMGFFLGGLRYREQVYNSTITQMSACLLSLSVISLVLPTAFHASFKDDDLANRRSLKISRGTSVILLIVYLMYLLFQLKSHAYMYESTPQHIVDAEAIPGPAAGWLNSSSSEDGTTSASDSDDSHHSRDTVRRKMRKVLHSRRRAKSSATSQDGCDKDGLSSSFGTSNPSPHDEAHSEASSSKPPPFFFPPTFSTEKNESAIQQDNTESNVGGKCRRHDCQHDGHGSKKRRRFGSRRRRSRPSGGPAAATNELDGSRNDDNETKRVDFAIPREMERPKSTGAAAPATEHPTSGSIAEEPTGGTEQGVPKRPAFQAFRTISVRNFAPTVFTQRPDSAELFPIPDTRPVPRVRYGIRRTNSLPDRLSNQQQFVRAPGGFFPPHGSRTTFRTGTISTMGDADADDDGHLTRWAAVILLLITTGLVAVCAEFLVDSIRTVTSESSSIGEIFIGLIVLPIVGNAAEHVTAITVAMKNKMDLAIGVAVGSSIQIALFVTPLIVILGWIMERQMTLYFTLFETVCLFVSTFIVNFLVLDGRSNYLEGALLCAVYVIIAVVAFFYPSPEEASNWGS